MVAVIPAKKTSSRVPNKNWRPFHADKCLVEVKIEQLLKVLPPEAIYLSCDDQEKEGLAEQYNIKFLLRDSRLADDQTSWSEAVVGIVDQLPVPHEEEVLWAEATSPLFDVYDDFIRTWNEQKANHDSIVAVNELREFLLDEKGRPLNFEFGKAHCFSQQLPPLYSLDSCYIMTKKDMISLNYMIGNAPFLYVLKERSVEIDTMWEFELAQNLFEQRLNG